MTSELKEFILKGDFDQAKKITNHVSYEELDEKLTEIAFNHASISVYTFIMSLVVDQEQVELHEIAFDLLVNPLCHIEGAYYAALYHARRCIELTDRQNAKYLSYLLFLHDVPDKVVSGEEAHDTANKILQLDANHEPAKMFLNDRAGHKLKTN